MSELLKGKLIPLGDRIILRPDVVKQTDETSSGIIIPGIAKENDKPLTGTVLEIGPGVMNSRGQITPISEFIKVGSRVYFGKFTGVDVEHEDGVVVILHEDEILGVLE